MADFDSMLRLRQALAAGGYRPLAVYSPDAAVSDGGKRPIGTGWQDRARQNPPEASVATPTADALNTGILCDGLRAIDIDVDDPATARLIREMAEDRFGATLIRTRPNSPRVLLLYRDADGETAKEWVQFCDGAGKASKVEVLGRGQQFVAYGRHPSGVELQWDDPRGAGCGPQEWIRDQIPAVSREAVTAILKEVADRFGGTISGGGERRERSAGTVAEGVTLDSKVTIAHAVSYLKHEAEPSVEGRRGNDTMVGVAMCLGDLGISEATAVDLMAEHWNPRCVPPWEPGELEKHVGSAYASREDPLGSKSAEAQFGGVNLDALRVDGAEAPHPTRPARPAIRLYSPAQCAEAPPRGYLVKGMLAPRDVGCIFGQPGAGKSIVAPHIGYAVAQGRPVFGCRTRQGLVFYVAAEDPTGMRQRVTGLRLRHGDADGFQLVEGVSNLLDAEQRRELAALVAQHRPALIMIDTVAMAFPGTDENASRDMGQIVAVARELTEHGAAVVLIHHQPKDGGDTPRGHSLLNGALDMSLMLTKDDEKGICQGRLKKNRNGSCDLKTPVAFRIRSTELGRDEDGDPVTAPIADELSKRDLAEGQGAKLSKSEAECLRVLCGLSGGQGGGAEGVAEASWQGACEAAGAGSGSEHSKNRRDSFRRTLRGLEGKGAIARAAGGFVATMSGDLHNAAAQFSGAAIPPAPGQKSDQTSPNTKTLNEQNAGGDVPAGPLLH
ncbi:AAA family ATPase [Roseomonas gilardii]|uniref:AAA family ATPase n=1 Tax=Roseomonas gilardii TaxID=257708 RepID=A0ABU3ML26_9PROT|nr:AAA family ATPase [Roseomonas gilardii]MDT8333452.1 AAA family ATPase [Roseomonas gilardii]